MEHLTADESVSLFIVGVLAPALILGGLASVAGGIYQGVVGEFLLAPVFLGGVIFGAGCGLLGALGYYHWHRDLVESHRDDKMPIEYEET